MDKKAKMKVKFIGGLIVFIVGFGFMFAAAFTPSFLMTLPGFFIAVVGLTISDDGYEYLMDLRIPEYISNKKK